MRILRLDELAPAQVEGTGWFPIRSTLGVRAFGINAYAGSAGARLINEHDETESLAGAQRHEELYIVLRGGARFTVDSEDVELAEAEIVFVDDPSSRRRAVATRDETLVLAIGGPVGEPYRPPPWEAMLLEQRAAALGNSSR
jgi:mannose-6-phosphate isomerase-like protein (cupin superfamily)